jgi:hypothetical protein
LWDANREAKNTGICRLFGRFDVSTKGCQAVLLLDHIICMPKGTGGTGILRRLRARGARATNQTDSKSGTHEQAVAAMQKGRSVTATAFLIVDRGGDWTQPGLA